jgi:hypothetical protein
VQWNLPLRHRPKRRLTGQTLGASLEYREVAAYYRDQMTRNMH